MKYMHIRIAWLALCIVVLWYSLGWAATASWDEVSDPELQGYRLYRAPGTCATPGAFATINAYGVVTTGPVTNPATNGTYCHRLTAFNAAGESPFSNTVELNYVVNPPVAPQNLTVK
jgi:hypothetical protein